MNTSQRLRTWASSWTARQTLAAENPPDPVSPAPEETTADSAPHYTVSTGNDLSAMILDRLTASITPDDASAAERSGAFTVSASGARVPQINFTPGQVRQLNPVMKADWDRPVIVLVLEVPDDGDIAVVVPFGPFSEPAFEGEFTTGIPDEGLSVLCIWNTTSLPLNTLGRSWWLTTVTDELLHEARILHGLLSTSKALPAELLERIGPPITHRLDPRHDYLDMEAGLLKDMPTGKYNP